MVMQPCNARNEMITFGPDKHTSLAPKVLRIIAQGQPSLGEATLGIAADVREANPNLHYTPS